jgi:hypothetical protein
MAKKEKSPESRKKKLEASIDLLRKELDKKAKANKGKPDSKERYLRRQLKKSQRKLAQTRILTLEESLVKTEALLEQINRQMDEVKGKGKTAEDAYYHSLSKKSKSLNKKLRSLKRQQKKAEAKKAKAEKPAEEKSEGDKSES